MPSFLLATPRQSHSSINLQLLAICVMENYIKMRCYRYLITTYELTLDIMSLKMTDMKSFVPYHSYFSFQNESHFKVLLVILLWKKWTYFHDELILSKIILFKCSSLPNSFFITLSACKFKRMIFDFSMV